MNRQQQAYERINNLSGANRNALFSAIRNGDVSKANSILGSHATKIESIAAQTRLFVSELSKNSGMRIPGAVITPQKLTPVPTLPPAPVVPILQPVFPLNFRVPFVGIDATNQSQQNMVYMTINESKVGALTKLGFSLTFEKPENSKAAIKQLIATKIAEIKQLVPDRQITGHFQTSTTQKGGPGGSNSGNKKTSLWNLLDAMQLAAFDEVDAYTDDFEEAEYNCYYQ